MSSTYYLLCMSHDPAITITELGDRDPESLPKPDDLQQTHPNCDFLITRHSGALIEVGCPGFGSHMCGGHKDIQWVEADWLRVLALVTDAEPDGVRKIREKHRGLLCWDFGRIHRLRYELSIE